MAHRLPYNRRSPAYIAYLVLWPVVLAACGEYIPLQEGEAGPPASMTVEPATFPLINDEPTAIVAPSVIMAYEAPMNELPLDEFEAYPSPNLPPPQSQPITTVYPPPAPGGSLTVRKLNHPLQNSHILQPRPAPDGKYVVYVTGFSGSDYAMYSVPVDGGKTLRLATNHEFIHYDFAGESQQVVYSPVKSSSIWSVPISGGVPIELFTSMTPVEYSAFQVSPDRRWVVLLAHGESLGLYAVPIGGGVPIRLKGLLHDRGTFTISPNSQYVVYRFIDNERQSAELHSVPVSGGESMQLNGTWLPRTDSPFDSYIISPDSTYVVFEATSGQPAQTTLVRVPISGGEQVELAAPDQRLDDYEITSDGKHLIMQQSQHINEVIEGYPGPRDYERAELYGVPISGGARVRLSAPLVSGGTVEGFVISPDGRNIVYHADLEVEDIVELYIVSVEGGPSRKLSLPRSLRSRRMYYRFSPDGAHVVYGADHQVAEVDEVYSVAVSGRGAVQLGAGYEPGSVRLLEISPDSQNALYVATERDTYGAQLFLQPLRGGDPLKLNAQLVRGGNVEYATFSPDMRHVVYLADQETNGVNEIYVVSLDQLP